MKKNKRILILVCGVLAAAFILGVTGVLNFSSVPAPSRQDTLIGFLITREYLDTFDREQYLDENIGKIVANNGGEISLEDRLNYGGRIWAETVEKPRTTEDGGTMTELDYIFEGIEGLRFIYPAVPEDGADGSTNADGGISDVSIDISDTDAGRRVKMKGTIYFSPQQEDALFYYNHVYQMADGRVYAVPGDCISMNREDNTHGSMGMTASGSFTAAGNGQTVTENGSEFCLNVQFIDQPVSVTLLQFGGANGLLKSETFAPGKLPESFNPEPGTEWIIADTETASEDPLYAHTREIYGKADSFLYAYSVRADGLCTRQACVILWEKGH